MKKTNLAETVKEIETWCSKNNISPFYGEINEHKKIEINWINNEDADWEKYLNVLNTINSKILTITIREVDIEELESSISKYLKRLDKEDKKYFESALSVVKANDRQIANFILTFFDNNICYQYLQESDWLDEYERVLEARDFDDDDDEFEAGTLSEKEIEEMAQKITSDKKYQEAKNKQEREKISNTLVRKNEIHNSDDEYDIALKAEEIFEEEVKPKLEAELRKNILDLKAKGLKKVAVASKLKIKPDIVNIYWYDED